MIRPLGNMLLVEEIKTGEKVTQSGLVLSNAFADSGPKTGTIIAMGPGEQNYKGDIIPIVGMEIGSTVYYSEHSATDIEDDLNNKYLLINCKNILAVKE